MKGRRDIGALIRNSADHRLKLDNAIADIVEERENELRELQEELKPGNGGVCSRLLAMKTAQFAHEVSYEEKDLFDKLLPLVMPHAVEWVARMNVDRRALLKWCLDASDAETLESDVANLTRLRDAIDSVIIGLKKR